MSNEIDEVHNPVDWKVVSTNEWAVTIFASCSCEDEDHAFTATAYNSTWTFLEGNHDDRYTEEEAS